MSEARAEYRTKHPNPTGIPARWLRLLYRLASLQGGRVYNIILSVPEKQGEPVTWAFLGDGKRENEG